MLSYQNCSSASSLYIPMCLRTKLWRNLGPSVNLNGVDYKVYNIYNVSFMDFYWVCGSIDIVVVLPMSTSWTLICWRRFKPDLCQCVVQGAVSLRNDGGYWNFPTILLDKSRYLLYWVESTINQQQRRGFLLNISH